MAWEMLSLATLQPPGGVSGIRFLILQMVNGGMERFKQGAADR